MSGFGQDPIPGMDATVADTTGSALSAAIPNALLILNGPGAGRAIPIPDGRSTAGRDDPPEINVEIDLSKAELGTPPMVSRKHVCFDRSRDGLFATDLGSTNGTWMNEERLYRDRRAGPIPPGARLRLGNLEMETIVRDP